MTEKKNQENVNTTVSPTQPSPECLIKDKATLTPIFGTIGAFGGLSMVLFIVFVVLSIIYNAQGEENKTLLSVRNGFFYAGSTFAFIVVVMNFIGGITIAAS